MIFSIVAELYVDYLLFWVSVTFQCFCVIPVMWDYIWNVWMIFYRETGFRSLLIMMLICCFCIRQLTWLNLTSKIRLPMVGGCWNVSLDHLDSALHIYILGLRERDKGRVLTQDSGLLTVVCDPLWDIFPLWVFKLVRLCVSTRILASPYWRLPIGKK